MSTIIINHWLTLQNTEKMYEAEKNRKMKARKVLRPPLTTAGPIFPIVSVTRSSRVPEHFMNI